MNVHDDRSLDAELDRLRDAPAPRMQLRQHVLAAIAREPRAAVATVPGRSGWRGGVAALWRELGGTRLAAPAFGLALAFGLGMSWLADDSLAGDELVASNDDLVALAQFDDAYEGLEP